jgi:RHS repeat-associated protein
VVRCARNPVPRGLQSATYTYDAAGQRIKSAVTVAGTTTTTNWVYDGITLMSLSATQGSSSWRVDCLYDEDGTPYGGVYRSPSTSTSPTYFTTITNDRGDVVELLDANGAAFAAYHYDAWGLPQGAGIWTVSTGLINATLVGQMASRQVLRYAGYAYDSESGLYYCSARYYDPTTRQWTTADSAEADGEESAYQYCDGNPVCGIDNTGREVRWFTDYFWCTHRSSPFRHPSLGEWRGHLQLRGGRLVC